MAQRNHLTDYIPARVPVAGQIISVSLQLSTAAVLAVCLTRRTQFIQRWSSLPLAMWLIIMIYVDSTVFIFTTAIMMHGIGINSSPQICEGAIFLCLTCYLTTKIMIYYFLVEKAYIVRGSKKPRLQTKLWLFNCLCMLLPFTVFAVMNLIFRITYINPKGVCIIGMQEIAMLPLIAFEIIVNIYLTLLFVVPLRNLYSYQQNLNPALNRVAFRSMVGTLCTLSTSVTNLVVIMVLKGEPAWICFTCCNADILFCVTILHWVTSKDKVSESTIDNTVKSRHGASNMRSSKGRSSKVGLESFNVDFASGKSDSNALRFPTSVITTECTTSPPSDNRGPRGMRITSPNKDDFGDEIELNNIHVQTIHTVEVEVEGDRSSESLRSDQSEWAGTERVVGEKLV
ncbi:hypothetical protein EJ02DRAFT_429009 [Clathrospora elynae]|uniref:Uncharacterized protein n=1 Tax=Clathrospora elynae TaxID=706981 RepID=A0A6A5S5P2_9PLEO|nr:hypothetical protein EJ02DRAFT_429009 [Clathrospora elynae]